MSTYPRITLVTPSYNQGQFLEQTIDSVLSQGYPNLDYIVIDGGSTDDSVGVIRKHGRHLSYWVSEPDSGQSDALIKGFSRGTGELINWINSDDLLQPGALHAVAESWLQTPSTFVVGQDHQFSSGPDQPVGHFLPAGYAHPDCLKFWSGRFRYHQPPTFMSRAAYDAVGGLRPDLHYVMDYDLYCRMLALPGASVRYLDRVLSAFRLHPGAKTARAKAGFLAELREVSQALWPADWDHEVELQAMNRYSAECALFQAAESFRSRDLRSCSRALGTAARLAPWHAARFALSRWRGQVHG
ncbi:MAG: glycosyltransferase family 2 protein [Lysobacterales bacterium]